MSSNGDHPSRSNHLNCVALPCPNSYCSCRSPSRGLRQRKSCFSPTIHPRVIAGGRRPRFCVQALAALIAASLAPYADAAAAYPCAPRATCCAPAPASRSRAHAAARPSPLLPAHLCALRPARSTDAATSQPPPPFNASCPSPRRSCPLARRCVPGARQTA
ncbi:hypothetical protein B0H15DRAFT_444516 [Mycena belliarum]|uniref:Uncharacterized protein n=1 Tax=Mycena belliarum TaxID=1033014 RepID=A0AAD6TZS5_9AGAR|nr:hypothetical protein B0H15DRAFT_188036 [Mycena belliae]KAJ7082076.1 hypothetical protein B0H15DRAFT_444516 [Mycena belliae]